MAKLGFNNVILSGYLVSDADVIYMDSGDVVCKLPISVSQYAGKGKGYNGSDYSSFVYTAKIWLKNDSFLLNNYFRKGAFVTVQGELLTEEWTDNGAKHSKVIIGNIRNVTCQDGKTDRKAKVSAPF